MAKQILLTNQTAHAAMLTLKLPSFPSKMPLQAGKYIKKKKIDLNLTKLINNEF